MRSMGNAVAVWVGVSAAIGIVLATPRVWASWWSTQVFAKERTLQLRTKCPDEGERWSRERFVVIDGQMYVRLNSRMAARVQCNALHPLLGVEVAGQVFNHVRGVPAPLFAERVAKAMADKYKTDILVRLFRHPLTLLLTPE